MTSEGQFIELHGTAEGEPFARESMDRLMNLAGDGIGELMKIQRMALHPEHTRGVSETCFL